MDFGLNRLLLVAFGGALGALFRYGTGLLVGSIWRGNLPLGTWTVNLAGCFLIGLVFPFIEQHAGGGMLRYFFVIGFIGSFTTFSAFSLETVTLWQSGEPVLALVNAVGSVVLGLGCVGLGMWAGNALA